MHEIRLYGYELASMPEYSTTLPTGTTLYKMWKRDDNAAIRYQLNYARCPHTMTPEKCAERRRELRKKYAEENWFVGQYLPSSLPDNVLIRWYKVVLRHGPMPPRWNKPDWHNETRYRRCGFG